jgi:hypothetical protein
LRAASADTTIGRRRCVQRGIHSAATDQLDAFGKLADDGAIDVGIVGEDEETPFRLAFHELRQHLGSQHRALDVLGLGGLGRLLRAVEPHEERQRHHLAPGQRHGHGEHDPIVAEVKVGLGPGGQQRVAMHTG